MAHLDSGNTALATKAGTRRARVAIFGGTLNKKQGRRGPIGAQFNRNGTTPKRFVNPTLIKKKVTSTGIAVPDVNFDDDGD